MSRWDDPMTHDAMSYWASHLAEPSSKVLTSLSLLQKYEAVGVKIRQENVDIHNEELEEKAKCRIRHGSPRGPGPHTCPSCGATPWKPLYNGLCDHCGLQVALAKSWKASGCAILQEGSQKHKIENAHSDDNDNQDDVLQPAMSNRARKARGGSRNEQPPRQCPSCKKKTWEHMPLRVCDRCGMQEAMHQSWIACQPKRNGSTDQQYAARQTAASSSWKSRQETSAASSSQAASGRIRTTSRHNKISSTTE